MAEDYGCFPMTREPMHLNSELSSGNTLHLTQGKVLQEGTERAHSPNYLLLGSHLFLLRRKKTVEEERGERKKGGRGKGRKKKEN